MTGEQAAYGSTSDSNEAVKRVRTFFRPASDDAFPEPPPYGRCSSVTASTVDLDASMSTKRQGQQSRGDGAQAISVGFGAVSDPDPTAIDDEPVLGRNQSDVGTATVTYLEVSPTS